MPKQRPIFQDNSTTHVVDGPRNKDEGFFIRAVIGLVRFGTPELYVAPLYANIMKKNGLRIMINGDKE